MLVLGCLCIWGASVNGVQLGWGKETRKAPDTNIKGPLADSVYDNQYKRFKLENFNPRELVIMAKDAGAKYIVIITKHHDGFHMWNTKYSDYNIMKTSFENIDKGDPKTLDLK
jgi:Alpha-L-fucosidase